MLGCCVNPKCTEHNVQLLATSQMLLCIYDIKCQTQFQEGGDKKNPTKNHISVKILKCSEDKRT